MIADQAKTASQSSLPQLSGGLLWAYRAAWALLGAAALLALLLALFDEAMHPIIVALRLLKGTAIIAVAAILLRRRHRDPVAGLLSLSFLCWTITSSVDFASAGVLPLLLDRLRFLLFVLALLLFPDGEWRPRWTRKIAAASALVFLVGVAETLGLLPTSLFLPLAIACVIAAVASLVVRFRTAPTETHRQQLRWVALGLVSGIGLILGARAGAALDEGSARHMDLSILWEGMFQLGIVAIALGFLVSLLRYRLYDAEAVISRSAAYAVLTVSVLTSFAATEGLIEGLGQRYLDSDIGDFSAVFAASTAALLFTPLHRRIEVWAEHRFQRDLVLLKQEVPELVNDLSASVSPRQLGAALLPRINEATHAIRSALMLDGAIVAACNVELKEAQRWARTRVFQESPSIDRDPADTLFPLRLLLRCDFCEGSGWLLLGPRPDGSLYGKDELDALCAVRPALRHGLALAVARERRRAAAERVHQGLFQSIRDLQARLDALECDPSRRCSACARATMRP